MDIITGYTGTPHITAENDRDINIGIFGSKSYVLQTGTMLTAEISNNNEIKVRDGVIMHQGCAASIKKNTYDSVTINNGSQGMKRIDLIVARYEKQPETNVESLTLKVLQGTPAETSPQVPAHTEGDIQAGDTVADMPLYEVEIDGLNITEIRKVFQTMEDLESVNGKLEDSGWVDCTLGTNISIDNPENGKPKVRKIGNMVILSGTIKSNTTWSDHEALIKIPDGYRPKKYERFICAATGQYMHRLDIPPSGTCTDYILNGKRIPSGGWLQLEGIWYV